MNRPLLSLAAAAAIACAEEQQAHPTAQDLQANTPTEVDVEMLEINLDFNPPVTTQEPEPLPTCDPTEMFGDEEPSSKDLAEFWNIHWPEQKVTKRESASFGADIGFSSNIVLSEGGKYLAAITQEEVGYCTLTPCSAGLRVNGEIVMAADPNMKLWMLNGVSEDDQTVSTFMKINLGKSTYDSRNYADINLPFLDIQPLCE
jgi:hypothetical protein